MSDELVPYSARGELLRAADVRSPPKLRLVTPLPADRAPLPLPPVNVVVIEPRDTLWWWVALAIVASIAWLS